MHQNLLNAEFGSVAYPKAGDKNMHVFGVMSALTTVSRYVLGLLLHICLPSIALSGLK